MMNKEIDTSYTFSYPCKLISSFFDNYYGKHIYKRIKEITSRKKRIATKEDRTILRYFEMFSLFQTTYFEGNIKDYSRIYRLVFNKEITSECQIFINYKITGPLSVFELLNKYIYQMRSLNNGESFLLFLITNNEISNYYRHTCMIPQNIYAIMQNIKGDIVRTYFLYSYFNSSFEHERLDLKTSFVDFIHNNEKELRNLGINELYLFGSVDDNSYHDSSDIDIIIKYDDNITFVGIDEITKRMDVLVMNEFKRHVDVQEYYSFCKNHKITESTKIL